MEILGVGIPEITFIVLLALILLGPKDMAEAGRTIGRWLRRFVHSSTWQALRTTGKAVSELPTRLIKEAGIEEFEQQLNAEMRSKPAHRIQPPIAENTPVEKKAQKPVDNQPSKEEPSA